MISEKDYIEALDCALKTKKQYLTSALEMEGQRWLTTIGLDGWSENERKEQYEQEVVPYWNRFGLVPKRFWFELNGSRDHHMNPRFLPDDLYYTEILPYMNNAQQRYGLANKGYYDYLFSDVKRPKTVVLKIEGIYCDEKRNIIRIEDAIGRCRERNETLFIKRTTNTRFGDGITVFVPMEHSDEDIRMIFEKAGPSFIVQEKVRQHPLLNRLNPLSACTIRVLSLIMNNEVFIESAMMRIGGQDSLFITDCDDGINTEILKDHRLHPKALINIGKWIENGGGLYDDSFIVPSTEKLYDEVRRLHPRMSHFKCLGWDFTIDEDGDPVFFEFNVAPAIDISQMVICKPLFNERTDWILEDYFERRTWEQNHRQDILIQ